MKKNFLSIGVILLLSFANDCFGQSADQNQSTTKTLENGVVMHSCVGVEGIVTKSTETPVVENSIEYWNEDQLRETIEYIKVKSAENCSVKEYNSYEEQLKMLQDRLKQLEEKKQ